MNPDVLFNSTPRNSLLPEHEKLLDPKYAELYKKYIVGNTLEHQVSIEEYRKDPGKYHSKFPATSTEIAGQIGIEEDITIPVSNPNGEIKLRLYRPVGYGSTKTGVYLHFHGGGWTLGSIGQSPAYCRLVASKTGCTVVDVDYRLGPEYKFPVALEDCWSALKHVVTNQEKLGLDVSKALVVGGISAGGHLAIYLTHRARDDVDFPGVKITYAVITVPIVDATVIDENFGLREDCPYPSWKQFYNGPFLSYHRMAWFYRYFLPENPSPELLKDSRLSPMHIGNFKDLPPCIVVTAEIDVLRDEGKAYYEKLKEAGVDAEYKEFKGVCHPFVSQTTELKQTEEYLELVIRKLQKNMKTN